MHIPRIVIAGTHSGVGKTSIVTGLLAAIARKGMRVQPFKVGPDYIDPGYHTRACGVTSRNLDSWMVSNRDHLLDLFVRNAKQADMAVIEGVMGLYDGKGESGQGSTAEIAKLLRAPVVLVVNVKSMARSAAAIVMGYKQLDPEVQIAGVIINRVASQRHYQVVCQAIELETGIPVIGAIGNDNLCSLPERHLGLVPTVEKEDISGIIDQLGGAVAASVNLDQLIQIAQKAPPLIEPKSYLFPRKTQEPIVTVGYALDAAFNFYYQDSLDLLKACGALLKPINFLVEKQLPPDLDGLLIGGGFPEMFLDELSGNKDMRKSIACAIDSGMPVYAECGGFMYLTEAIFDFNGNGYPMVGAIPATCRMERKLVGMGYRQVEAVRDNLFSRRGERLVGHEFHYSSLVIQQDDFPWAFRSVNGGPGCPGFAKDNVLASYLHIHLASNGTSAKRFIELCWRYKNQAGKGKGRFLQGV